ncbi:hypothetical protein [Litchfieldia salsa]|uniref:Uncharacterized protein n=1 Tax=Litchfieldia salsa TaxID=930152 RepID=A0A1H0VXZ4_9BACI|nr:hypothetical protein [Litchfieldia salsa]SDP82976.1 hypothetical protein SAMN05216565_10834 [Litchfieldia salsa]
MIISFKLKDKDDVLKLNKIATGYTFDIWVHSNNEMFDAKTLLALYTLPLNRELRLVVEEGVQSKSLEKEMEHFK